MCSTPQKHPAAIVALAAPSGEEIDDWGLRLRDVEALKGLIRREMKFGMAIIRPRADR